MQATPPPAEFSWTRYRSATLAGLTPVIPVPFLDDAVKWVLARRVPGEVAAARQIPLPATAESVLNRSGKGCSQRAVGCLLAPFIFMIKLPLKLFRKLLVFLLVRAVANELVEQWGRAYLIDVALQRGELSSVESAEKVSRVIRQVVREADEPLMQSAKIVFAHVRRLPLRRMLRRAEQSEAEAINDERVQQTGAEVESQWNKIAEHLELLGQRYVATMDGMSIRDETRPTHV